MGVKTFAAIDIGSFELSMTIFEFSGKNRMRKVESLSKRLALGSDTYADGKISNEKMEELCSVLIEFAGICKAYKVDEVRACGTSAIRETDNLTIVLDKIRQRTGISVEVLSNSEQRFLDYKSVASKGDDFRTIMQEGTAILDIGGGSLQISLFENDTLVSTQNLKLGVLRLEERLKSLNAGLAQQENLITELAAAQLSAYKKLFLKDRVIRNIIIVDDYISPWALRKAGREGVKTMVDKTTFRQLLNQLRELPHFQAAVSMDMSEDKVPLLFISAVLTNQIAKLMGAETIWVPGVTISDGMAYEYAEKNHLLSESHDFDRDIVACARNISKRYQGSKKRGETLLAITGTIFDSMKKIHGLGKREALYLELAAILHDCGKYISMIDIGERSYDIIMATEMIGLSHMEREIVANVVRFNHSDFVYYDRVNYGSLDREAYLKIAKLTAILRLASSLDRSHKQKMKNVKASLADNRLLLTVDSGEDILLEQSYFAESAVFFEEVYSVVPVLRQKKNN